MMDSTSPFSREKLMSFNTSVSSKFLLICSTSRIAIAITPPYLKYSSFRSSHPRSTVSTPLNTR